MAAGGDEDDLPTVEAFTDPFLGTYTPPPALAAGICPHCRTATGVAPDGDFYWRCWSCGQTRRGVSRPLDLIVPISLYRVGEQLHTVLKDYKRSPDADVRERHLWQVGAMLHRFIAGHRAHIVAAAGSNWDTVTIVPSKTARVDAHPLETAILLADPLAREYLRLLEPDDPSKIGRNRSSDEGFRAVQDVSGKRILLVDDTFTTGASLQSAASTLSLAGAEVVAGVVIGRVIDPSDEEGHPEKAALWRKQRGIPFSFGICCLE